MPFKVPYPPHLFDILSSNECSFSRGYTASTRLALQGVVAFMFIAVLKVQPGIGLQQGAKKLGEAFLSAWALSQLTKVPRALGSALLPLRAAGCWGSATCVP